MDNEHYKDLVTNLETFYDVVGPKYELIYPDLKSATVSIASSIVESVQPADHSCIVDLGCGQGRLLSELARINPHFELHGFDISSESIRFAKEHFGADHPNIRFHAADWRDAGAMLGKKADLVLCLGNTLTHYPPALQAEALAGFSEMLNPGGHALIDSYKGWNDKLNDEFHIEPKGITRTIQKDIISCFFSVYKKHIAIRNICFMHYDKNHPPDADPVLFERYVTHQYPFSITAAGERAPAGFSQSMKISLKDDLGLFDYFLLKK